MTDIPPGGFSATEVFLLHEIATLFDHRARVLVLDSHDLTYTEFLVLVGVRERPEASHTVITQIFGFSASAVSQKVSSLLRKGLLTQQRDAHNRRMVHLQLTDAGRTLLDEVYDKLAAGSSAVFDTLGERRAEFRAALIDLAAVLRAKTPELAG